MAVCSWEQQLARLAEQRLRYSQGSPGLPPANLGRITPRTYFPFDCSSESSMVQPTLACVTVCMRVCVHVCAGRAWRTSRHCSSGTLPPSVTLNLLTGLDQLASQPPSCPHFIWSNLGLLFTCVCVFTFISSVGHRVEVRELAQVVPFLAPCGF